MENTVFKNDIIGITQYYRVIDRNSKTIKLENTRDKTISSVSTEDIDISHNVASVSNFHEVIKVSKSGLLDLMTNAGPLPFSVEFTKQDGTKRTLRGTFLGLEPHFGRSIVNDLDIGETRQVDNRTIESLIINKIKYEV